MIRLSPPLTVDGHFSVTDLPTVLHLPLLNGMVVPRIVSSSMVPTIQAGDRLELSPPSLLLTVGRVVVFKTGALVVCHRVIAIDGEGTLTTKGDATAGACEFVQPAAVIGMVTGVIRQGTRTSLGIHLRNHLLPPQTTGLSHSFRRGLIRGTGQILGILAKVSFFQEMLSLFLLMTTRVDILIPAPLRSFSSYSTRASFRLHECQDPARLMAVSDGQQPAQYVVRLGAWRLAQYHPSTGSLLLRQSLQDAGLAPFFRQCFGATQPPLQRAVHRSNVL